VAQPTPYERVANFQDIQSLSPSTPLPGQTVDTEFNAVVNTFNAILANLALIQRDDTALANQTVGFDQLKAEVLVGINPATVWAAETAYVPGDVVINFTSLYRAIESHTSTADFSEDLNTGFWELLVDLATDPLSLSGDITVDSEGVVTIADNAVSNAKLAQGSARSVVGVTGNSTANRGNIVGTADQILRISGAGDALAFGSIDLSEAAAVGSSILALANGGTGADDAAGARTALELGAAAVAGLSNDVTLGDDSETDAVTEHAVKTYVDTQIATGFVDLDPVVAATTTAGTLASDFEDGDTVDGVVLATGDRVLIKDQADESENGVYTVEATGAPTRATDNDETGEFVGRQVLVLEGTANEATKWKCSNTTAPVVDTDDITFVQTQAANSYSAGTGLTLTGQEFTVDGTVTALLGQVNAFTTVQSITRSDTAAVSAPVGSSLTNAQVNAARQLALSNPDTGTRAAATLTAGDTDVFAAALVAEKTGANAGRVALFTRDGGTPLVNRLEIDESGNLEIQGALTAGDAPGTLANLGGIPQFADTTDAAAADVSAYGQLYVHGYASLGDGGHGLWRNVSTSEPTHDAKFQDAGGDWWEPAEEIINTRMIGMVLDGSTDDRTAWQTVVSMINSNLYRSFLVPIGNSIVSGGALDTITGNFWTIRGASSEDCVIEKTGTTNANLFTMGTSGTASSRWRLENLELNFDSLSGTPSGVAIKAVNGSRWEIDDVRLEGVHVGLQLGSTSDSTTCTQSSINGLKIDIHGPGDGAGIDDQGSNNIKLSNFFITASDGDAEQYDTRGIWMHPGAGLGGDAWKVMNGEINLTNANCAYALDMDGSQQHLGNRQFTNVVFDRGESASVRMRIGSSISAETNHSVHAIFTGCVLDAGNTAGSGAVCFDLTNQSGDGSEVRAIINGCQLTANGGQMINFVGASPKKVAVTGNEFLNRSASPADVCIDGLNSSVSGTIVGNFVGTRIQSSGSASVQPEHFLGSGSITNLKAPASVNDFAACSGGFQA
jgi:hypothetical protein